MRKMAAENPLLNIKVQVRDGEFQARSVAVLIKLFESEIKFMLKLQIGQILTSSKSDLSGG